MEVDEDQVEVFNERPGVLKFSGLGLEFRV